MSSSVVLTFIVGFSSSTICPAVQKSNDDEIQKLKVLKRDALKEQIELGRNLSGFTLNMLAASRDLFDVEIDLAKDLKTRLELRQKWIALLARFEKVIKAHVEIVGQTREYSKMNGLKTNADRIQSEIELLKEKMVTKDIGNLQTQRLEALRQRVELYQDRKVISDVMSLFSAQRELLNAELEQTRNSEERMKLLEAGVANAKKTEKVVRDMVKFGVSPQFTNATLKTSISYRIQSEIDLAVEKNLRVEVLRLRKQKREELIELTQMFKNLLEGGDLTAAFEANHRLLKIDLELAKSKSERVNRLQKYLDWMKSLEAAVNKMFESGVNARINKTTVLWARAKRIQAEIDLLSEKKE